MRPAPHEGHEPTTVRRADLRPVDLLVHLPVGVLTSAHRLLPELVSAGREQTERARQLGVMAVAFGRIRLDRERTKRTPGRPVGSDASRTTTDPTVGAPAVATTSRRGAASRSDRAGRPVPLRSASVKPALPIDGYDLLPAADIVPLLPGLTAAERRVIAAHESAGRQRRTILNRLEQLETRRADSP